jgi:hypothetical protein
MDRSDTTRLAVQETHVNHEERGMKSEAMPVFVLASGRFFNIDLSPALRKHQRNKMDVSEQSKEEAMFDGIALMLGFSRVLCTGSGGHRP